MRMSAGEALCNQAADRQADEKTVVETERLDQLRTIVYQLVHVIVTGRAIRQAVAAFVEAQNFQPRRQAGNDFVPQPKVGTQRIGEYDRRTLRITLNTIMQGNTPDLDHLHNSLLSIFQSLFSSSRGQPATLEFNAAALMPSAALDIRA